MKSKEPCDGFNSKVSRFKHEFLREKSNLKLNLFCYRKLEVLNVSYPDELGTSNILENSDTENNNFINVSVDSNLSIEHIDYQMDIVQDAPTNCTRKKTAIESISHSSEEVEQLNVSYNSNDSIEIHKVENNAQSPGT